MSSTPSEVHLRVLTSDDVEWLVDVETDQSSATPTFGDGRDPDKVAAMLDEGQWSNEERWAWAVVADGTPVGYALVDGLSEQTAAIELRLSPTGKARSGASETLRQLADHHFSETPDLQRLTGRVHEQHVPMQRAFTAAGFRMEARYRDSLDQPDGRRASEWGYGLTRADWLAGAHRADEDGYDLHGLSFVWEETIEGAGPPPGVQVVFNFLQEGRRALARYSGGHISEGELAGVLVDDVLTYRFVADIDRSDGHQVVTGSGRARVQRRQDGRLEVVNDWSDDLGRHAKTFLVERR